MRFLQTAVVVMISLGLTGCLAPAEFRRPDPPDGIGWSTAAADGGDWPDRQDEWWRAFGDHGLDAVVPVVLGANNDLLAASLRARRAMLDAELAGVAGMPKLSGGTSGSGSRPFGGSRSATQSFESNLSLSYELDLWGRAAAVRDIAALEASSSKEDLEAARLKVIAATVSTWWRLAHTNQMLDSASAGLAVTERTAGIVETMRRAETASELEHFEITQTLEVQRAAREALLRDRAAQRLNLAVLLNGSAATVAEPRRLPSGALPQVPPGLPASLISRRPDLRAAEMRLRAALRRTDEKKASFYPPISLTGGLGAGGEELTNLLANPIATLGTRAALPFLNVREMGLQIRVSEVQYEEVVNSFRASLLTALSEVSGGLSIRGSLFRESEHLRRALEMQRRIETLYETRFQAGSIPLRPLLEVQERTRLADNALIDNRLARLLNEATLIRALGGAARDSVARPNAPDPALN